MTVRHTRAGIPLYGKRV